MNLENTTESLRDQLVKFMAEEREEKRREKEANEFAPKFFVGFWLVIIGIAMNLENTTECICDQLMKFVAEQMEEKRMKEERRESNEWPEIIIVGFLVIVDLTLLGLLLPTLWHSWKSRRAGPVTRTPKTPISKENLLEDSRNELKRAKVYYDPQSNDANFCTRKLKEIMRTMNLETSTQSLCNKLKVIVAKQAKEKRMKENTFITLYLMAFGLAILAALICLLVKLWRLCKSRCAGRVTRIPKTPISKENLLEFNRKEISRARFYYDLKSYRSNCCTKKLEKIWKVVFNLEPPSLLISFTRGISIGMDEQCSFGEVHNSYKNVQLTIQKSQKRK
ncbi:hypothetical protein CAEBREN_10488 [Caenorhabditis brenneri]|uniref:Uncharacterized protein n=1 Tax=Caenorhabditis brenneri TaxID=135651 RepID=G0MJP5_CAEBE|nr:hypothetical protein CAEBREN_10488 [Caenorhabditis brenneri]